MGFMDKIKFLNFYLILALLFTFLDRYYNLNFLLNPEIGIIEITQVIIIILNISLYIKRRYLFKKFFSKWIINCKIIIFSFLLWEEISFVTQNKAEFFKVFNWQGELNIHNSIIGYKYLISGVPILGNITLYTFLILSVLLITAYGNFVFKNKNLELIFLGKKFKHYILIYPFILTISTLLRSFGWITWDTNVGHYVIQSEFIELYLYFLFYFDGLEKFNALLITEEKS